MHTFHEHSDISLVKSNDLELLKSLTSDGASSDLDINAEDENGVTALIEACIIGNQEMVEFFLASGCPAQPPIGSRHTPLRGATITGNAHLVPILLKAGADPNALSAGDRTPLMGACFLRKGVSEGKSVECVKAMLEDERTDPTIRNSFGETALDMAKIRGYTDSIPLIEEALNKWNN